MRLTARLLTILISSEELQSKKLSNPCPKWPHRSLWEPPNPLHSSHKHLDLSLWKLTSFPESPYIPPRSASSCQMCYLSGNCWNFPDRFYSKGKKYLSHQCTHTVFWDWRYLAILYVKYKVPYLFPPYMMWFRTQFLVKTAFQFLKIIVSNPVVKHLIHHLTHFRSISCIVTGIDLALTHIREIFRVFRRKL